MNISLVSFLDVPYDLQMKTREWRNSEQVTKYFRIPHITEEQHKKWLASLHNNPPSTIAFMIMDDAEPVGVTYFHAINYDAKEADWGIYIYDEKYRGKGIGNIALADCIKYAKENLKLSRLYLDVKESNHRAINLYEKQGFKKIGTEDANFLRYRNDLSR